jgi:hypothetical protein
MITTVTSYKTSDGKSFETAEAAEKHEAFASIKAEIAAFAATLYKNKATQITAAKAIEKWVKR